MRVLCARAAVVAAAVVALIVPAVAASAAPTPVLGWTPTTSAGTYDYGTLTADKTPSTSFKLTNSGGAASSALTITLSGSAAFTKTADACTGTSLGPGKSCMVTVRYAPASQADQATLSAGSNKPAATASLALRGARAVNTITVTNPGKQTSNVNTFVQLQIIASDSDPGQTLTYTATGLPYRLFIDPTTGLIDGPLFNDVTYNVQVVVTDTTGASASTSFTWEVDPV